jgi:hypothetical protein
MQGTDRGGIIIVETVNEGHATIGLDNGWRRKERRLRTFRHTTRKVKVIGSTKGGVSCMVQMSKESTQTGAPGSGSKQDMMSDGR